MSDSTPPPAGLRRADSEEGSELRCALGLVSAAFDAVGAPRSLLAAELEALDSAGETASAVRGLVGLAEMLVVTLALESGRCASDVLASLALDVERLYPDADVA